MSSSTPAKPHPGERLASYFDSFFKTIVGVCTLGASLTFSKIIQTPVTPWISYGYTSHQVQTFIGISWLFFILDLAFTSFAASALSLYRPAAVRYFGLQDSHRRRIVMWWASAVSFLLFGLLLVAFLFLGLVVVAYLGPTGWTAVGFTAFFGLAGIGSIVWQSPIGSKAPGVPYKSGEHGYVHGGLRESIAWEDEKADEARDREGIVDEEDPENDEKYQNGTVETLGLSRRTTLVRPVPAFVPPYTEEVRRNRAYRSSQGSGKEVSVNENEVRSPENKGGYYYQDYN